MNLDQDTILPDILKPGIKLIICGWNPGPESAERQHYFSHEQNKFWEILEESKLTPIKLDSSDDVRLPKYSIGLTDLLKQSIHGDTCDSSDEDQERLNNLIHKYQPKVVAFIGKRPASGYFNVGSTKIRWGLQNIQRDTTHFFVVPDPSPANGHFKRLKIHWHDLASFVV